MAWKWTQTIASWFTKLIQSLASLNTLLEDNTIQNAYEIDSGLKVDNVYATLINHSSTGLGMQYSANDFKQILLNGDGESAFAKEENINWTNYMEETPTKDELKARILEQIKKVPENGLYIFFYGGHGGKESSGSVTKQCLFLSNSIKVYDYELWEMFKQCKGRIFAVFDCCYAGTMYREPGMEAMDRPFGMNWIQNCNQVYPRGTSVFQNYSGNLASTDYDTFAAEFKDNEPVYVKLTDSDGVKMVAYSASPEQWIEVASQGDGGFFTQTMKSIWQYTMKDGTYEEFFNKVYQSHRKKVKATFGSAKYNGHQYAGMSLCTYTDGFDPSAYKMFK